MLDYTDSSVLRSPEQTFHGMAEIRAFFQAAISGPMFAMVQAITPIRQDIHEDTAYVVWKSDPMINLGSDTFFIKGGKILAQTFVLVM